MKMGCVAAVALMTESFCGEGPRKNWQFKWWLCVVILAGALIPLGSAGQNLFSLVSDDDGDDFLDGELKALMGDLTPSDVDLIHASHLSYIRFWDGVKPVRWRRSKDATDPDPEWRWHAQGVDATPVSSEPIACLIEVPEAGEYRVYLRYVLPKKRQPLPVRLTMTPQKTRKGEDGAETEYIPSGGAVFEHTYGEVNVLTGTQGAEQEKTLPVRFGRETDRIGTPAGGGYIWEYHDASLEAGVYRVELASGTKEARVTALFITRSKDFRPSLSLFAKENTLSRLYMRFRVVGSSGDVAKHNVGASFTFHWRGRSGEDGAVMWGARVANIPAVTTGEWSPFVDATDPGLPIPGWATLNMGFGAVTNGTAEIQFAWQPREEAVLYTARTATGSRGARLRVPCARGNGKDQPNLERPLWGVWLPVLFASIQTQEEVIERYFLWAKEAEEKLGLPLDHPTIKGVRIFAGNGVLPPHDRKAYEMLASLGINWMSSMVRGQVAGPPRELIERYDLYDDYYGVLTGSSAPGLTDDERKQVKAIKWGDEIHTAVSPEYVNANKKVRVAFHANLEKQAERYGADTQTFYGVSDLRYIDYPDRIVPYAGRFQRRIFYLAQRYRHIAQVPDYKRSIAACEAAFPNVSVYNNYSPHPVFLTGLSMNLGDWFVLARNGAQTLAWGEDWAGPPTWDLGTDFQCVSYYAALVECAARKHGYPSGFYVVLHSGGPARKIFSCIGQGVTWLHLYSWGPIDAVAEGSNAWSENRGQYYSVMAATHALGPADRIVSKGEREPRRTAILYNRSYEMWTDGLQRLNHDWMWSFIALKSDQIPVEVIIEEDLNPETLTQYKVLCLGGYNLEKFRMKAIREWVEAGGMLIGGGGFAVRDEFNDQMQETVDLFGATQTRLEPDQRFSKTRTVHFNGQGSYPAADIQASGALFRLDPTTATAVAHYEDGGVAAVERHVGKGRTILLGMPPGFVFQNNGKHTGTGRLWHNAPALKVLGRQRVEYSHHTSETTLFEHKEGLAVLLSDFELDRQPDGPAVLSVRPEREITEVVSGLRRPLKWKRNGDRIDITVPRPDPVDVVILR